MFDELRQRLPQSGTAINRSTRYYTSAPAYRKKGRRHCRSASSAPLIILSTLVLLGTGVALLLIGPTGSGLLLTARQTTFWIADLLRMEKRSVSMTGQVSHDSAEVAEARGV